MSDREEKYTRPVRDARRGGIRTPKQYRNPYTDQNARRPGRSEGEWRHDMHDPRDTAPSRHLRITNLHYEVTEAELKGLFQSIGPVESGPSIDFDRSGRSTGRATVTMKNANDAEQAIADFSGAKAKGQTIYVSFDQDRRPGRRGRNRSRSRSPEGQFNNGRGEGLASRLAGPDLATRLSSRAEDRREVRDRYNDDQDGRGRGRGRRDNRGDDAGRGGRAAQGGRGGARAPRGQGRDRRPPTTKDDLDAELDAFMNAPPVERESKNDPAPAETAAPAAPQSSAAPAAAPANASAQAAPEAVPPAAAAADDVEMEL